MVTVKGYNEVEKSSNTIPSIWQNVLNLTSTVQVTAADEITIQELSGQFSYNVLKFNAEAVETAETKLSALIQETQF